MSTTEFERIEWLGEPTARCARLRGLLSAGERDALFAAAIAERRYFVEASTGGADDYRRALVHYTTVDEADPVVAKARALGPSIALRLGVALDEVRRVERQLTVHHDGGFYGPHRDNQGEEASRRALTYVYYFHAPKRWSGGELCFTEAPRLAIEPEDNSLVVFDAGLEHAVHRIASETPLAFDEGRFTINGWLWR